jgi:hypothetical protein
LSRACPGSKTQIEYTLDPLDNTTATDYEIVGTYDALVPQSLLELYQSGLDDLPETVSSFFDIQTRQWTTATDPKKENGKPFLVDAFRMLEPLVLNNAIEAKEGLVVDTKQGQIAFRHHRTPNQVGAGAEWSEDLLVLEPVTECVNTNLTIEFKIPPNGQLGGSDDTSLTLIDNGGFVDLVQHYPTMNVTTSQEDPQLRFRAYKAAWLVNVYSMLILNVTRPSPNAFAYLNSERGKRFALEAGFGTLGSASTVNMDQSFYSLVDPSANTKSNRTSSITNETISSGLYDNPFNLTTTNYTSISILCQGAGGADLANSSNIFVQCGLVYGAAVRTDGTESLIFEPGDTYQRSVYTCASTTRASIKTVGFKFNTTATDSSTSTSSLQALSITNITAKSYASSADAPLWAIETLPDTYTLADVQQLWGLISGANQDAPNMTAIRAPHLHLPGYSLLSGPTPNIPGYEFIPGSTAPAMALAGMYSSMSSISSTSYDYTGSSNLALFQKWQALSKDEAGIANMLGIVWADIAANLMTGTRGWGTGKVTDASGGNANGTVASKLRKRDDEEQQSVMVPVKLFERKVQYNWVYGIPAYIVLAMFLGVMMGSCCCLVLRRGTPARTKYYLNGLSAGRLLAEGKYPGVVERQSDTKIWVRAVGGRAVGLESRPNGQGEVYNSAPVTGTPGAGSPYLGPGAASQGFYPYAGKPAMGASATELSNLTPMEQGMGGNGYMRVHG